jgi:5-methylcytosine-specific restriction endonuclease McrA
MSQSLTLSTRSDKVFLHDPHIASRASYLLLKAHYTELILAEWEEFRNEIFDEFEAIHHTLSCCYCNKTNLVREIIDPCNKDQLKTLATIEHIVALSKGGKKYDKTNCTIACFPCNNRRKNKAISWMNSLNH